MNFSVGPTVQNLTIFRGKNRKFWLGPKWLGMTQGVQKSLWFWAGMKIQLFPIFGQATKNLEKRWKEAFRNPTDPLIWWSVIWTWIRFWIGWTWIRFLSEAKPNHVYFENLSNQLIQKNIYFRITSDYGHVFRDFVLTDQGVFFLISNNIFVLFFVILECSSFHWEFCSLLMLKNLLGFEQIKSKHTFHIN